MGQALAHDTLVTSRAPDRSIQSANRQISPIGQSANQADRQIGKRIQSANLSIYPIGQSANQSNRPMAHRCTRSNHQWMQSAQVQSATNSMGDMLKLDRPNRLNRLNSNRPNRLNRLSAGWLQKANRPNRRNRPRLAD